MAGEAQRSAVRGSGWPAWRVVVGFGMVSLAADMVYEGGRSVYGPLLASLGGSAAMVGWVTGAGEATALVGRLVSGPLADRSRRYWALTLAGYALTAVCVPLLAITPVLGAAGLAAAIVLILAERFGKAVRSPAKSALLAEAASQVGLGRGLGVHKALDQVGAFAGPLLVAGVIAAAAGALGPGLAVLMVPGAASLLLLVILRGATGDSAAPPVRVAGEDSGVRRRWVRAGLDNARLPGAFWWFSVAAGLCTAGLVTFGLIGFHLARRGVVPIAAVPVLYAVAMAAGAVAALLTGVYYDRAGARVLLVLPLLIAAVPVFAFARTVLPVTVGVLLWGAAVGLQDSTVKALVADLVERARRATAYGWFAAVQGLGALIGGVGTGVLYEHSTGALIGAIGCTQLVALAVLLRTGPRLR